jgi:hypothetical protein
MSPRRTSIIGATALAATAALGVGGVASAQTDDAPPPSESERPGPGRRGFGPPPLTAAAEVLGIGVDELRTELHGEDGGERRTLAEVAQERGVDPRQVIDAMVADANEHLDQAVADGKLTAERAEARREHLVERITRLVNEGPPARFRPGGPERMAPGTELAPEGSSTGVAV